MPHFHINPLLQVIIDDNEFFTFNTQIYNPWGRITIGPRFGPSNAISHRRILSLAVYRLSRLVNLTIHPYQMS